MNSQDKLLEISSRAIAKATDWLHRTCRFYIYGERYYRNLVASKHPALVTIWHFAFPAVIYFFRHEDGVVMVSRSRDGELAARVLHHLGYRTVRGSSHRGGSQALRKMLKVLKEARGGGFVADGSQGPPRIAQKGILLLARYLKAPLIPLSIAARPCIRVPSWDRTLLAFPFSKIVFAFGPPIWVPGNLTSRQLEDHRRALERELNTLTGKAEEVLRRL